MGVSGISGDVRILEASDDPCANEALDLFAYRATREIGSLMAALGGLDVLVFTGGIGEHGAAMRARICDGLGWSGVLLDAPSNARIAATISHMDSSVRVQVIEANEELPIARATRALMA